MQKHEYEALQAEARKRFGSLDQQIQRHPRLAQAVGRREYVLFLGAGISKSMGYPLWDELVDGVRLRLGRTTKLSVIEPLQQAQVLWNYFLEHVFRARPANDPTLRQRAELEFNRLVLDALDDLCTPTDPPEWFQLLQGIRPRDVVTTNWDHNLEQHLYDGLVNVFNFRGGRPARLPNLPNLYKIHGTQEDPRYLVFTEDQFQRWEQDDPYLVSKLRVLFSEQPTLCLGYSFRDPNVQAEHFRAFLRFQGGNEPVYLLIDPALSPMDEWGRIREQGEYFGSRDVTLLFGSVPEALAIISSKAHEYVKSREYQLEALTPVLGSLQTWVETVATASASERISPEMSMERARLMAKALIGIGLDVDLRLAAGLETASVDLPHRIGTRLLNDVGTLLGRHEVREALDVADYARLCQLMARFTARDAGCWQFEQHTERLMRFLDLLPFIPDQQLQFLAPALAEHLLFAGKALGDAWYSWDLLAHRIADIPEAMIRPLLMALLNDDDWISVRKRVTALIDEGTPTRIEQRVTLLSRHPKFDAQLWAP